MSDPNRQEVLTRLTEAYARADKAEAELAKRDKALEQITRILASSSDAFGVGEARDIHCSDCPCGGKGPQP
jgi:hypothetical protein